MTETPKMLTDSNLTEIKRELSIYQNLALSPRLTKYHGWLNRAVETIQYLQKEKRELQIKKWTREYSQNEWDGLMENYKRAEAELKRLREGIETLRDQCLLAESGEEIKHSEVTIG